MDPRRILLRTCLRASSLLFMAAAPSLVSAQQAQCVRSPHGFPGWWSSAATDLIDFAESRCYDESSRNISISSPDGKKELRLYGDSVRLTYQSRSGPTLHIRHFAAIGYPAEISWAPDSNAFYITESNGSLRGFQTTIYFKLYGRTQELPNISPVIWSAINDRHQCSESDTHGTNYVVDANIAGVRWLEGSSRLLVVAETPEDSDCVRGYFAGYVLALADRKIVARYSPDQLIQLYPESVGRRLRADYEHLAPADRASAP